MSFSKIVGLAFSLNIMAFEAQAITITLINNDSFGNEITVTDRVCNKVIFQGYIPEWGEKILNNVCESSGGYGNISVFNKESGRDNGYTLLKDGDEVKGW